MGSLDDPRVDLPPDPPPGRPAPQREDRRLPPAERYMRDVAFARLVDCMEAAIGVDYTPTEVREAALLAAIRYESRHIRPLLMVGGGAGCRARLVTVLFACADCGYRWAGPTLGEVQDEHLNCPKCGGMRRRRE